MNGRPKLQERVSIGALALLVALVAVLGTWQVLAARSSQRSQILTAETTKAHLASSALASGLTSRLELVSNLAAQPALVPMYVHPSPPKLASLASTLHLIYPGFASFVIVSASGRLLARWPADASLIGTDVSTSNFFVGVTRTGQPYVSEVAQQTAPPREFVVSLAAPVRDTTGKLVGILDASVAVSDLSSFVGGTSLGNAGELVIIDQGGHVLSGPAASSTRVFRTVPFVAQALAGHTGSGSGPVPGFSDDRLVGYAPVPSVGWVVLAEDPSSVLDGPIAALTERLLAIGLVVLLVAVGTALNVGRLVRRLARANEHAGAVLTSVGEGVATLDPAGRVVAMNPALERLANLSSGEATGRPSGETLPLYDERGRPIAWEDSVVGQATRERRVVASSGYEMYLALSDGRRIPIAVTAAPLVVGGDPQGAVVVVRDVSREREVDQLKSSLVSTVSHELRTPLTMIQGFSELLLSRKDFDAARQDEALTQIHGSAERLGRLIDDLLSVSRIESGKLALELEPVALSEVIAEVVSAFGAHGGARLVPEVEEEMAAVLADHDKTLQIVTNLVSNALKYSPDGSPVRIVARRAGDHAEVSVVDQGIGMSDDEVGVVFEKFTRADHPEVRRVSGTGLGLYISKSLVELQRGQLWVRSSAGSGSTFSFSLPWDAKPAASDHSRDEETV